MALNFSGASSQRAGGDLSVSMPLTLAFWFYTSVEGETNYTIAGLAGSSPYAFWVRYWCWDDPVPRLHGRLSVASYDGSNAPYANSTAFIPMGQWNHAVAVFAASNSRTVYLNGGNSATSTAANHNNAMAEVYLGCRKYWGGYSHYFTGEVAFPCVWNVALTAGDAARLSAGVHPLSVKPANTVWFAPLVGADPEIELRNSAGLTLVNSPTKTDNPRMFMPPRRRLTYSIPASVGVGSIFDSKIFRPVLVR